MFAIVSHLKAPCIHYSRICMPHQHSEVPSPNSPHVQECPIKGWLEPLEPSRTWLIISPMLMCMSTPHWKLHIAQFMDGSPKSRGRHPRQWCANGIRSSYCTSKHRLFHKANAWARNVLKYQPWGLDKRKQVNLQSQWVTSSEHTACICTWDIRMFEGKFQVLLPFRQRLMQPIELIPQ